jgi:hypothetical protein
MAETEGRNEGSQVEQLILFYEAVQQLNRESSPLTLDTINARKNQIWGSITEGDELNDTGQ